MTVPSTVCLQRFDSMTTIPHAALVTRFIAPAALRTQKDLKAQMGQLQTQLQQQLAALRRKAKV